MAAVPLDRAEPPHVLPDLLQPGLRVVFCGTAAGTVSARRGQYYAHPQNRFWPTLHAVGLTPRRLDPAEFALLPGFGVGLTDIAKHVFGMDRQLPAGSLGRLACEALSARILAHRPAILAFTSLTAGRSFLRRAAGFGEQPETIGATRLWLLPSPSPAANWNWRANEGWWRALAEAARAEALDSASNDDAEPPIDGEGQCARGSRPTTVWRPRPGPSPGRPGRPASSTRRSRR
ncbi:MAG: mismatch-specific DNA-glycosylase [Roseiarcus sp.]